MKLILILDKIQFLKYKAPIQPCVKVIVLLDNQIYQWLQSDLLTQEIA